ncbi:MAG: PAS domain-containing protein [Chitinophagaceae bacterium]
MNKFSENKKQPGAAKKSIIATGDTLRHLAFDNSLQANIISTASNGRLVIANNAACKLLGYAQKELLTKSRSDIFNIKENGFKKMLKQRTAEGHSIALVTAIKKSGKPFPCEITSAVFMDDDGIEKAITTIRDRSQSILRQKKIDTENEKVVAVDIAEAKSRQKNIDVQNGKIVAGAIASAKANQKKIDTQKEKIVADDIILAQAKSDSRLAENNEWIKYIAKASYDVMWDWDIATGRIYVGDSIKEVFGYSVKDNTVNFSDFIGCLLPEEKDLVEKKLMKAIDSSNKSWKDSYSIKRQDSSVASVTSRASIVRDEKGKAVRLIGAIQDISRLQELEKSLGEQILLKKEHSEIFRQAAKLSFDGIWDWNLITNDLFLGDGFEELFGYEIKNNKGNIADWSNYIHPDDKQAVEKGLRDIIESTATHWEHAYRFIRADGSVARVFDRANVLRHADGKAYRMIGAMQDLSRHRELEEMLDHEIAAKWTQLTEYKESFKFIFNSSSNVFYDSDLITDKVILSDAYDKEFGYKLTNHMTPARDWVSHIHPDDREAVFQDYVRMLRSQETEWKYSYRFLRADDSVANVLSSGIVLRNAAGKAYRMIGYMLDLSKQEVIEEKLQREIKLKEKQITEAIEEAKEAERSEIGRELHDNVNQLLGASKLYLDLAKSGGEHSKMYLGRSAEYTLTAIEEIRKLTKGLSTDIIINLGLCEAIDTISRDMMQVNELKIFRALESFSEDSVGNKFKLNVFRIVQEQLNNIIKHAKATEVRISLVQTKNYIALSISDNGVGFDTTKKSKGIGLASIKSRALSYNGIADFVSRPGQGCVLTATFPVADALLNMN